MENAYQVVTVSSYHRKYIADLCPYIDADEIEIVSYGIDTEYFRPKVQAANDDPLAILSVGRLHEKKGHEYLIDACAHLTARGINYRCRIVGGGTLRDALHARIARHGLQEQVELLGALNQQQILAHYQASDIFALACIRARSGDQDGMPNVLIEAMACELPVVTTPITGIPDLVQDGENGLIVPDRDALGLADALEKLSGDEAYRRRLGAQARQTILADYQIQRNAARMADIFRRTHQRRRADDRRPVVSPETRADLTGPIG